MSGVSIIIPVYNREHDILNAVNSIKRQTFEQYECIIVDDASTDDTVSVIKEAIKSDKRFRLIECVINNGPAVARNRGIRESKFDLISFLDSDDAYESTFLQRSFEKMKQCASNCGFIWTGLIVDKGAGKTNYSLWKPSKKEDPYHLFLKELRIGTNSGITVRKSVLEEVGYFDESLPAAEDTDLFLRITQKYSFDYVPEYLIRIQQKSATRLSKNYTKIANAYNLIIPKHLDVIQKDQRLRIKYFYKAMWLNYHLGEKSLARSYFRRVLVDDLFNVKYWVIFLVFELLGKNIGSKLHTGFSEYVRA